MNRQNLILIAVAVVSLLFGIAGYQLFLPDEAAPEPVSLHPTTQPPKTLAAIPLTDLEGQRSLIGQRSEDFLIVNFWAPWCAPCRREIPALIEIHKSFSAQGVSVLGIAFDGKQSVEDFASEYQINFPLFLAGAQISMYNAAFGNASTGLPFTAILDKDRERVYHHSGEITREQLLEALNKAGFDTSSPT